MRSSLLLLAPLLILTGCPGKSRPGADYQPRDGDFLFQSLPHNELIDAIEGSTRSPFSHCGIVVNRNGKWHVIEAIGPVKETPLPLWIAQGRNNAYVAYRLAAPLSEKVNEIIGAAVR